MRGIRSLLYQFSLLPLAVQYKHGRYERVKSRSEATLDSFVSRPELIECIYRPKLLNFFRPLLFILFLGCSIFSAFFAHFLLTTTEWGYVPFEKDGSQLLFQVISECYEKRSVIITTNLEFSKWNGIFYDEKLTSAIIDRLVHHSHLLVFQGQSYRLTHSTMKSQ